MYVWDRCPGLTEHYAQLPMTARESLPQPSALVVEAIAGIEAIPTMLDVVAQATGMGFAAVAWVTEKQWLACAVRDTIGFGLTPGGELKVETTICKEVRQGQQLVVIDHVAQDDLYCDHPTPETYGFQSYISVPIFLPNGEFFGTLCAIDPQPRRLNTPETVGMFRMFADLIGFHLEARARLAQTEARLEEAEQLAGLREQFVAVLGHDLRSPLAALDYGIQSLNAHAAGDEPKRILQVMRRSVGRISNLVDNMLDFTRARLGGGIPTHAVWTSNLRETLQQVVAEFQQGQPQRVLVSEFDLSGPVHCDADRIAQVCSNLLSNALMHGEEETPVRIRASCVGSDVLLTISNEGRPIPADVIPRLFQPFKRRSESKGPGLGLGLYIAAEIARSHGGELTVASNPRQTCFTLRFPRGKAGDDSVIAQT